MASRSVSCIWRDTYSPVAHSDTESDFWSQHAFTFSGSRSRKSISCELAGKIWDVRLVAKQGKFPLQSGFKVKQLSGSLLPNTVLSSLHDNCVGKTLLHTAKDYNDFRFVFKCTYYIILCYVMLFFISFITNVLFPFYTPNF